MNGTNPTGNLAGLTDEALRVAYRAAWAAANGMAACARPYYNRSTRRFVASSVNRSLAEVDRIVFEARRRGIRL